MSIAGGLPRAVDRAQASRCQALQIFTKSAGQWRARPLPVAEILENRPDAKTRVLLEHTAGQGTNLGHRFEHLAEIIERIGGTRRVGVCLDTCHLIAAGYDICSDAGYEATFRQFGKIVGFGRLKAFHFNDSKKPCGSRVDRHEHIGKGCLGLDPFRRLLNDPRFGQLPMLLETPKLDTPQSRRLSDVDPLDKRNLDVLRKLMRKPAAISRRSR